MSAKILPSLLLILSAALARPLAAGAQESAEMMPLISPPQILSASNPPAADGRTLVVTWRPAVGPKPAGYRIYRADVIRDIASIPAEGVVADTTYKWTVVGEAPATDSAFTDRDRPDERKRLRSGVGYRYRVEGFGQGWDTFSRPSGLAVAAPEWFNVERANTLIVVSVFFGSVLFYIRRTRRGKSLFVREIAGLAAADEAIGRATEMGRPVLYIPGIMDVDNIQTIASMVILTDIAKRVATFDVPLIVPLNQPFVVPLTEESVKEGCLRAGRPDAYIADNIRYLSSEQFAFTAGVTGIMNREKPAANFFLGAFFAESLIISEVGFASGAIQIAGTANVHQLPFFVVACDYTLIGEEFYAASAYLGKDPQLLGTLKGSDFTKALLMVVIVVGTLLAWVGWMGVGKFFGVGG